MKTLRYTLLSIREMVISAGPFILLAAALIALAYWWLDPTPPRTVVLATGPAQSAYDEFGKRYQKALARDGIEVKLIASQGAADNLRLLREGQADLGFVQGGTTQDDPASSGLVSLGSLFVEPIWIFHRTGGTATVTVTSVAAPFTSLAQLQGMRVNVGSAGSGVPRLMDKLLEANRLDPASIRLSQFDETPATVAFLNGEIDAVVFASAPESLMVQMLLQTPSVGLVDFSQSEAYSRRFPFLTPVLLPRGVVDLAGDKPPQDVRLVASTTALLARERTHPAVIQLFTQTARDLHGPAGWFNRAATFPTVEHSEFPVSREAERVLKETGQPFLQRWMPFWLANLVERMWLALGIIIALLLPLSRIVPPLYEFRIRSRVFRWYGQLREIEERIAAHEVPSAQLDEELAALETRVAHVQVPLSYAEELYALRNNIARVRNRLPAADVPPAAAG